MVFSLLVPISPHTTSTPILSSPPLALRQQHSQPLSSWDSHSSSLLLFSLFNLCPVVVQLPDLLLPALCGLILQSSLATLTGTARGGTVAWLLPKEWVNCLQIPLWPVHCGAWSSDGFLGQSRPFACFSPESSFILNPHPVV